MACVFQQEVSLAKYATLKTGGPARYFVSVRTREELSEAVRFAQQGELPFSVIGGGSNILVSDEGYKGVIIKNDLMGRAYSESEGGVVSLTGGAGEVLDEVIADAVARGYWGVENLSAIPGTVGATPIQNVGAYGVEVKDVITSVEVYDTRLHEFRTLTNEECRFAYRDSIFKTPEGKHYIVTAVTFRLSTVPSPKIDYTDLKQVLMADEVPTLARIREAVMAVRERKFPDWRVVGTAGSFFKNPIIPRAEALALRAQYVGLPIFDVDSEFVKISLAYLLDKVCHLKGYRRGNVGLHEEHALVLVNHGGATTGEILGFSFTVAQYVYDATGVRIEPEVRSIE